MADIQQLPTRAEFIRDRLAEYLDGLGHNTYDCDERDGFPCLTVEAGDGERYEDVAVLTDGRIMSMVDGWSEVRLRGFTWLPEPTDTGVMHGPGRFLDHDARSALSTDARRAYEAWQQRRFEAWDAGHRVPGTTRVV